MTWTGFFGRELASFFTSRPSKIETESKIQFLPEIDMDIQHFTEKSQEALNAAHGLAARLGHQQMDVEHLLLALLDQERGLAASVLTKAEVPVEALKLRVHRELEKL